MLGDELLPVPVDDETLLLQVEDALRRAPSLAAADIRGVSAVQNRIRIAGRASGA